MKTIYGQEHSRVEAVRWIYENIPSMFHLRGTVLSDGTETGIPVSVPSDFLSFSKQEPFERTFTPQEDTEITNLILPHVSSVSLAEEAGIIQILITNETGDVLSETNFSLPEELNDRQVSIPLNSVILKAGDKYTLRAVIQSGPDLLLRRTVIANENWDEGLPFPLDGYDPFGQLYTGLTNEVRWSDSEEKKQMFLSILEQTDYLILPSQRSVWSACRIPLTYPMTLDYYEALFDGSLGFKLAAEFQRPFQIGPLVISDLAGSVSWNEEPKLPVRNLSIWSAEEAFSIYDHPPVWIFKKSADFDLEAAKVILDRADLSKVVVQGPTNAVWPEGYGE